MEPVEGRPEITYPCPWQYKIIGQNESRMRAAIADIVGPGEYKLSVSKVSSRGRYCSLNLEIVVLNERHRTKTFTELMEHEHIKIVL